MRLLMVATKRGSLSAHPPAVQHLLGSAIQQTCRQQEWERGHKPHKRPGLATKPDGLLAMTVARTILQFRFKVEATPSATFSSYRCSKWECYQVSDTLKQLMFREMTRWTLSPSSTLQLVQWQDDPMFVVTGPNQQAILRPCSLETH